MFTVTIQLKKVKMASGGHLLIWLSTVRSLRYREGDVSLREAYAREKRETNEEKK